MRFLGVDTSSSHASVAVTDNGRIITETFHSAEAAVLSNGLRSRNNHAEAVLPLIDSTLTAAGLSLTDLSGFAIAIGPGSFTGLRIGLSTVKGLSYGSGAPVVGVSTLHAWAARMSDFDGYICAILDARKKELYAALFGRHQGLLERVTDDGVMSFEQLMDVVRRLGCSESILFTGDGVAPYRESLVCALGTHICAPENENLSTIAATVALLGEATLTAGPLASASALTPLYLRRAESEEKMRNLT